MKKIIIIIMIFTLPVLSCYSKTSKPKAAPKNRGMVSKIGDAATRGFGWGLGREAAKSTVNGVKSAINSVKEKKGNKKVEKQSTEKAK